MPQKPYFTKTAIRIPKPAKQVIFITAALFGLIELMYIISSMAGWGFIYIMTTVILSVIITSSAIIPIIYAAFLYDMDISHKHKNGYMLCATDILDNIITENCKIAIYFFKKFRKNPSIF